MYSTEINKRKLILKVGDITNEATDAVVNAANIELVPGGGVCGAIHSAAGPGLYQECIPLAPIKTGQAVITSGFNMNAGFVIHTVGPVYSGRGKNTAELKSAYLSSLHIAEKNSLKSVSFPSISTGIFGYPVSDASEVALSTIMNFLKTSEHLKEIRMILFSESDFTVYYNTLVKLKKDMGIERAE